MKAILNKDFSKQQEITFKSSINYSKFTEIVKKALDIHQKSIVRLFKKNGVEILPEDFSYVSNNELIYVSKGEDFNDMQLFAEYEIVKVLGEGGFGEVKLAKHKQTGNMVAIKFVKNNILKGKIISDSFT